MITTPALAFELPESRYDWAYETTMIDKPRFKRVEPANTRGKVLGGSSCLNYFTWLRGSSATYDEWVEFGGPDWSFDKCIDYFTKVCSKTSKVLNGLVGSEIGAKLTHTDNIKTAGFFSRRGQGTRGGSSLCRRKRAVLTA